jgi:hypothetical protein
MGVRGLRIGCGIQSDVELWYGDGSQVRFWRKADMDEFFGSSAWGGGGAEAWMLLNLLLYMVVASATIVGGGA